MMRALVMVLAVALLPSVSAAQVRQQDPERLRAMVTQRFMENYRRQAGLTDDQFGKFQEAVRRHWDDRRTLQQREQETMQALQDQLRPGVAADEAAVTRLLGELVAVQGDRVEKLRAEQQDLAAFLSPVQRAQLTIAFAQLEHQIEQLIQRRMGNGPGQEFP
jgi:hypothetical protein